MCEIDVFVKFNSKAPMIGKKMGTLVETDWLGFLVFFMQGNYILL